MVVSNQNPSSIGQSVTFTATVSATSPGSGTPTGTVTFRDGGASIGSGAVILCGIEIGARAMVGAGAVVTHDVPPGAVVTGNPARLLRSIRPENQLNPHHGDPNAD